MNYMLPSPTSLTSPAASASNRPDLTPSDIWKALSRRWRVIAITLGSFVVIAVLLCIFMTPRYTAIEVIQVQKEGAGPLGLDEAIGEAAMPADTIDYNITLQTQAAILQSDDLAVKAIEDLGLEKTQDFKSKFSPIGWALSFISPKGVPDPKAVALHDAPKRRANAIRVFSKHLKVKVTDGTRLISVSYSDPDPKIADAVVKHLVQGLIDYNFQSRYAATFQASKWLGDQLADLKKSAEDSQAKVSQLQKDAQVFSIGDVDQNGHVQSVSVVLNALQDLNAALSTAQTNRILKEAIYRAVQTGGADSVSGLAGNMVNGASPDVVNALTVIQNLRTQEATLESSYAEESAKHGPEFPHMQQLQSQLNDVKRSIHEEVERIGARAKSDFEIALQTENNTRALYEKQKAMADTLNSKAIDYTVAKQEADQNRSLYNDLFRRLKEAGAIEGLHSSNVVIMDPSSPPGKPKTPNVPIYLAASIAAGLFLGSLAALFVEGKDKSVKTISQVELELGVYPFGILPTMTRPRGFQNKSGEVTDGGENRSTQKLFAHPLKQLNPSYVEALRALRTSILSPANGETPRTILVTSCQPNVGKTSLSLNLAVVLSQQGHKVLIVECDMRRPSIQKLLDLNPSSSLLNLNPTVGLTDILTNPKVQVQYYPMPDTPRVSIVCAGGESDQPAELLGSDRMKELIGQWRKEFDFVILDSPPALAVTDPIILAGLSDIVLMVVRYNETSRQAMTLAYRMLSSATRNQQVGVIVNGVREGSSAFYEYYGYKMSPYGAGKAESIGND